MTRSLVWAEKIPDEFLLRHIQHPTLQHPNTEAVPRTSMAWLTNHPPQR
jgi:hypothetical protein